MVKRLSQQVFTLPVRGSSPFGPTNQQNIMKLKVTETQFEVLHALVRHVRLGQDNVYSEAALELVDMFESKAFKQGWQDDELPVLEVHFSDDEGIVLEFN